MTDVSSDGVLNPSGVRFGSSEIYSVLSRSFAGSVVDALCVGQQRPKVDTTERVVLFLKLAPGLTLHHPDRDMEKAIRAQIASDLSRRHVPEYIFQVDEIPYNANGKKLEIPVKKILCDGIEALSKGKLSSEETRVLARFGRFYDIERMSGASLTKQKEMSKL